jgi:ubiquinone/menaquinone biosynthesis C-methylase UbiE
MELEASVKTIALLTRIPAGARPVSHLHSEPLKPFLTQNVNGNLKRKDILSDMADEKKIEESPEFWDNFASVFDNKPDHHLRDPITLQAWTNKLERWLPNPRASVLDIGCGTGSLSVVIAGLGHDVIGVDFSPEMIARATAKAITASKQIEFHVMDAAHPTFSTRKFDVILCKNLFWALPEPNRVLERWTNLLTPNGRLVMIEGVFHSGKGLPSKNILEALPSSFTNVWVENLSDQPELWGGPVTDVHYVILASRS